MSLVGSIFLDFNLPNAATWFYFSLLLTVALFFKFSRFLSVRNWDVLTLFLLVPGLLILQEAHDLAKVSRSTEAATWVAQGASQALAAPSSGLGSMGSVAGTMAVVPAVMPRGVWYGYLWLLCGSGYFLGRCLFDLALVRRPALSSNLNLSGLAWLGGALFVCLVAVAVRNPGERDEPKLGKGSAALDEAKRRAINLVNQDHASGETRRADVRFWAERILAIVCHMAVIVALGWIGCRHFQDVGAGMSAATFYLLLPYTAYHVGQWQHVWPTALMLWAVAAYRRPFVAGLLLGLAAGSVYFPALLFPIWLGFYRGRGAGRFAAAFVAGIGLMLCVIGLILWTDGQLARVVQAAPDLTDWEPWRVPLTEGFWTGIHWAYRTPVFIAFGAFVLTTAFWPAPKNLAHVIALSAAVLIGIQFWHGDQGGVYVLWYLPFLLLMVFRPNLADRQPPAIAPETDWLLRWRRSLHHWGTHLLRLPEAASPVR